MVQVGVESENGWRPPKIPATQLDRSPIPGTNIVIPLMAGDVSRLMKAFIADVHQNVESLLNARGGTDEGGWTPSNSVATSNHLNGTAADLNWSDHPMGPPAEQAGWSPQEIAEMRKVLAFYNYKGIQLVFWAADWRQPKDSMHVQMGYNTWEHQDIVREFIEKFIRPDGFSTYRRGGERPTVPRKAVVPGPDGTFWADVSQYQGKPVDSTYPHKIFSFRTNSGDLKDTLAEENATRAVSLLDSGICEIVIPYYFFRPGEANCDLHREILEKTGLFNHPRTVSMVDVEGANGQVTGDNTWEINDEVNRIRGWYNSFDRVIGYWNPNADPGLWVARGGLNLVIPQYNRTPGDLSSVQNAQARAEAFAHQFTETARDIAPWTGQNVDKNWSPYNIKELLVLFGMEKPEMSYPSLEKMVQELYDRVIRIPWFPDGKWPSTAWFRDSDDGIGDTVQLLRYTEGEGWDQAVVLGALAGDPKMVARVERLAKGEGPAGNDKDAVSFATALLKQIQKTPIGTIEVHSGPGSDPREGDSNAK